MKIFSTELSKSGSGQILKRLLRERFCFEVYVVATELRRKMLATAAPQFLDISFLTAVDQKNSNETTTQGELNEVKSRIGTREESVAATCGQSAAAR